jgi:hypothetical protein
VARKLQIMFRGTQLGKRGEKENFKIYIIRGMVKTDKLKSMQKN